MHVKSLMGLKFWRSWSVDKKKLKLQQVRVFFKNHAQLYPKPPRFLAIFAIRFLNNHAPKFKISLGTCVFKKSCSTSNFAGMGALFR